MDGHGLSITPMFQHLILLVRSGYTEINFGQKVCRPLLHCKLSVTFIAQRSRGGSSVAHLSRPCLTRMHRAVAFNCMNAKRWHTTNVIMP